MKGNNRKILSLIVIGMGRDNLRKKKYCPKVRYQMSIKIQAKRACSNSLGANILEKTDSSYAQTRKFNHLRDLWPEG